MQKKQQKWIALFVALTFIWLMQVSTMPVAAAGMGGQAGIENGEAGPDYLEAIGQKAAPAKKKSMLPIILIGVAVLGVTAAVLFLVVLKTKYDILGSWTVNWVFTTGGSDSGAYTITFSGTKTSGNLTDSYGDSGTYTVDGKNVTWIFTNVSSDFTWTGKFDTKDTMSGTVSWPSGGASGTWTATRVSAATALSKNATMQAVKSPWSKTGKN
ncbi:MAG: hypothetical protein JXI33_10160 [Candidatus Aminicenantes bacterium]|nr:hypothetical protein [Candidatus Aminicenantes bacterium]